MGILKDVMDTIKDVDGRDIADFFKQKKYSSISKRSIEGTMQFPALVSKSLDIDTLQMICKALERQYASFAQIVLSMNPVAVVDKNRDLTSYLRQFHQNSDVKTDMRDVMNFGVDVLRDNYNCFGNEDDTCLVFACVSEGSTGSIIADNKDQLYSVLENVVIDKLNDKFNPGKNAIYRFSNANTSKYHNSIVTEADGDKVISPKNMDVTIVPTNILKDNDVKKSNELVPTTLHIRLVLANKEGQQLGYFDFIIGIKVLMHPINSNEITTNMVSACKNSNKFFDFIRWTSGEINFFKDFLFNIKEIKDDVANRSSGSSGWWITLKRRKALAKFKDALMLPNQILPNSSLVMSMEEVEYIKTNFGFDLMNPVFVDKIMQTYFLLGFVVVDNSTQICHFMFDGQQNFQSVTFNALERENSAKVDTKEILKLMNKA